MENICGECKWHEYENISQGWICVCDASDYFADWTDYEDSCEEFEEKESKL